MTIFAAIWRYGSGESQPQPRTWTYSKEGDRSRGISVLSGGWAGESYYWGAK
jgi:hypothetical protein